jgi:hypothetical protein
VQGRQPEAVGPGTDVPAEQRRDGEGGHEQHGRDNRSSQRTMPSDAPVLAPVRRGRPRVRDVHAHERSQANEMPWRPAPVPPPAVPGRIVPDLLA